MKIIITSASPRNLNRFKSFDVRPRDRSMNSINRSQEFNFSSFSSNFFRSSNSTIRNFQTINHHYPSSLILSSSSSTTTTTTTTITRATTTTTKARFKSNEDLKFLVSSNLNQTRSFFSTSKRSREDEEEKLKVEKNKIDDKNQVVGRSGKVYSLRTVRIIESVGKILGYNLGKSNAITLTSDYYDRCAERFEIEKEFWIRECGLPDSFQTWFQVTQLHMWLLTVRFRSMRSPMGKVYNQEIVNHAFIDLENRMRSPPNRVTKNSIVKDYMKILLHQHLGLITSLDWSISQEEGESDQFLSGSIWRNFFGGSWGNGMDGVVGIFNESNLKSLTKDETHEIDPDPEQKKKKKKITGESQRTEMKAGTGVETDDGHSFEDDVRFVENLERLVRFIRKELVRLDRIPDRSITSTISNDPHHQSSPNLDKITNFGKI